MDTALLTSFLIALLAIANPLGKMPVWVQACGSNPPAVRNRLALLVTGTAFAILCLILVAVAAQLIVEGLGEAFPRWLGPESPIAADFAESAAAQSGDAP